MQAKQVLHRFGVATGLLPVDAPAPIFDRLDRLDRVRPQQRSPRSPRSVGLTGVPHESREQKQAARPHRHADVICRERLGIRPPRKLLAAGRDSRGAVLDSELVQSDDRLDREVIAGVQGTWPAVAGVQVPVRVIDMRLLSLRTWMQDVGGKRAQHQILSQDRPHDGKHALVGAQAPEQIALGRQVPDPRLRRVLFVTIEVRGAVRLLLAKR